MDFSQIQELIRMISKHKITELEIKDGEFKLVIRNQHGASEGGFAAPVVIPAVQQPVAMPLAAPAPPPPAAKPAEEAPAASPAPSAAGDESRYLTIKSPMVGTFYRSSGPDKPPFVKIGDSVDVGNRVCIIEAMKLFNEIESDVKGKIVKILCEDATPVEYDQPLFLVDPA